MIGAASALTFALMHRVPGISGILGRVFRLPKNDTLWRVLFLVGLIAGASLTMELWTETAPADASFDIPLPLAIAAGLIVGFGTRLGGGCTSGHGISGIGRGSIRSIVATMVFMVAAMLTVYVARHVVGGGAA